jgi:hypothetical protein
MRKKTTPSSTGNRKAPLTSGEVDGLAQAFVLGADHIGDGPVPLVLGDNISYGPGFGHGKTLKTPLKRGVETDAGSQVRHEFHNVSGTDWSCH